MSRFDFYHLQNQTLEDVLPKLLEKAYETGKKIKVKVGTEERVEFINTLLWTYNDEAFIPHGSKKDGFATEQPIWLTNEYNNPNDATMLFLVDSAIASLDEAKNYERIFNIFDGNAQTALEQARSFWKELKNAEQELYYWQQSSSGSWQQK